MKSFSKGVAYYTKGFAEINFPEDDVCCHRCPLMGIEMASSREYCRMSGELLSTPKGFVGHKCPLKFVDEENDDESV